MECAAAAAAAEGLARCRQLDVSLAVLPACHREAPFDLSEAVNRRGVDVQDAFLAGEEGNESAS